MEGGGWRMEGGGWRVGFTLQETGILSGVCVCVSDGRGCPNSVDPEHTPFAIPSCSGVAAVMYRHSGT